MYSRVRGGREGPGVGCAGDVLGRHARCATRPLEDAEAAQEVFSATEIVPLVLALQDVQMEFVRAEEEGSEDVDEDGE